MSDSYLNAHCGVCIGGMFFKKDDKVHVIGRGYYKGEFTEDVTGHIYLIGHEGEMAVTDGAYITMFDYRRITLIEHVKEEKHEPVSD